MNAVDTSQRIGNIHAKRSSLGALRAKLETEQGSKHWLVSEYTPTKITAFLKAGDADAIIDRLTDEERVRLLELAGSPAPKAVPSRPASATARAPLDDGAPWSEKPKDEEPAMEYNPDGIAPPEVEPDAVLVIDQSPDGEIPAFEAPPIAQVEARAERKPVTESIPIAPGPVIPGPVSGADPLATLRELLGASITPDQVRAIARQEIESAGISTHRVSFERADGFTEEIEGRHHYLLPLVLAALDADVSVVLVAQPGCGAEELREAALTLNGGGAICHWESVSHRTNFFGRFVIEIRPDEGWESSLVGLDSESPPFDLGAGGVPSSEQWLAAVHAARVALHPLTIPTAAIKLGVKLASRGVGRDWLIAGLIQPGVPTASISLLDGIR